MNARKLPSGKFRARAYDYTDQDGKKHYQSFTASTKREAERLAQEFYYSRERSTNNDRTVQEAINGYIEAKSSVLSPATVRIYRQYAESKYSRIGSINIQKLTTEQLQRFISDLSISVSPKTVSNIYGLLSSALSMYMPDRKYRVSLPKKKKRRIESPDDDEVMLLFYSACDWMKVSIGLAAFCSLRRGEISALQYKDLNGNKLHVHRDMVKSEHGWIIKEIPKTSDSDRYVTLPKILLDLIGKGEDDDFIVKHFPGKITNCFISLRNKLGLSIKFHDLRHYYASTGAVLDIPDIYMAGFGGWRPGSNVMKEVYQNKMAPVSEAYADKMTNHFDSISKIYVTKYDTK